MPELTAEELLLWYDSLYRTVNTTFLPLLFDRHRYLVLMGGGGSGKSVFAARKTLERCVREAGHRILVCRKVAKTLKESCYHLLVGQIEQYYPGTAAKVTPSEPYILLKNGSEILFAGLDNVEKLKSICGITGIWIEEASELDAGDFNQLDIRLRGETPYYKQIILSFNPISVQHWLKRRFFDRTDPNATVHHSTYRDNRFLDADAIRVLEGYRESDPYYYQVYCLGQWGVTGKSVFDSNAVCRRLSTAPPPAKTGLFRYTYDGKSIIDWSFCEGEGALLIWQTPEEDVPYVIGCDTAGEGSDSFVAQVLDNRNGNQAAVLRCRGEEDMFVRQLWCLGMYYNRALIGVETNFSTYPVRELERLAYPFQYVRERQDDYTHTVGKSYGFRTDALTRPVILSNLIRVVHEAPQTLFHRETMEEMLTFVRDGKLRPAAAPGTHDDCVMSLAIAHAIRTQQRSTVSISRRGKPDWTPDMWQDYRNATPEQREYLEGKWAAR